MRHSLEHLPALKQNEIRKVAALIRETCDDVEQIILYGSYARGNFKEAKDLATNRKSGHISDYDILVVTEKWQTIHEFNSWNDADKLNLSAPVRISAINIEKLNAHLEEAHYLYSDIEKEGVMLYDSRKYKLSIKRKLKNFEQQRVSQEYFDHWFDKANDFVETFSLMMKKSRTASASFHMHQIIESCYKCILLVFENKNPNEHHIHTLGQMAEKFHPDLPQLFPKRNQEERARFELLEYAYIGGRYDPKHKISKEDLEILSNSVIKLLKITEEICKKKIASYRQ